MGPVGLGQSTEQHGVEIEAQQGGVVAVGLIGQVIGYGADRLLQADDEQIGNRGIHLIGRFLIPVQLVPVTSHPVKGALESRWSYLAQVIESVLIKFGGIHAATALDQVMRLVHQQGHTPVVEHREAVEQGGHVEVVVVITDHHIGPAAQLLAQVIGTHPMLQGDLSHGLLV